MEGDLMRQMRPWAALWSLALAAVSAHAADSRLLAVLMPEPELLAGVHVDQARSSPFGQFLLTQAGLGAELDKLRATTGFDPRTDLKELLLAANADGRALAAGRGNFQPVLIAHLAASAGLTTSVYRGVTLIGQGPAVAFLDATTVVLGPAETVTAAIDRWITGARPDPPLVAQTAELSAGADGWAFVSSVAKFAAARPKSLPEPLQNLVSRIGQVSGVFSLGDTVAVRGAVHTASAQDAEALSAALQLLTTVASQRLPGAPLPVVTRDGSTVNFALSISEPLLENLLRLRPPLRAAAGR
jgi:hypothetical protein